MRAKKYRVTLKETLVYTFDTVEINDKALKGRISDRLEAGQFDSVGTEGCEVAGIELLRVEGIKSPPK